MITEHVNRIPVHLDGKTIYDIVLEDSFDALAKEISALGTEKKKICIIADSNVAALYLDEVTKILSGCCRGHILRVPGWRGEQKFKDRPGRL